jgi:hypothetical protein
MERPRRNRLRSGQLDAPIDHAETALRLSPRERTGTPLFYIGAAYSLKPALRKRHRCFS